MVDPVTPVGSALQATLTGDLLQALSSALASGSITNAPPSIQNTTTPLAISGTLLSQVQDGGAVVQTAAGPVTLALNSPPTLPQGTLTLLIQPGNPPTASVVAQQAVTPQAQIQTQATAAQQTQDIQTAPATALPPLAVGQVLTATPLQQTAPVIAGPTATLQAPTPVPLVGPAASGAALASAVAVDLPIAVLLNSAIPPAPSAPTPTFVTKQGQVVEAVEPSPEEEAVGAQSGQAQPQSTSQSASQAQQQESDDLIAIQFGAAQSADAGEEEEAQPAAGLSPQANALAAQEAASQESSPTPPSPASSPAPQSIAYSPGTPVPSTGAQAGATQSFVVLSIERPESQTAGATAQSQSGGAQPAGAQTITATVQAQTSTGQPLLSTADGALLVNESVSTTVGTELVLQRLTPQQAASQPVTAGAAAQNAAASSPVSPAPLNDVPITIARQQTWPALAQLLTSVQNGSPQAASFLREAIPTLGGNFAQVFTAFLARGVSTPAQSSIPFEALKIALPSGLGASATPAELRATLLQLGADIATSAGKATASIVQPQAWQSHSVPILTDYGLSMAQLFVRQQVDDVDGQPGKKQNQSSTRFLVEISPSKLGPVQLDGLLRKDRTNTARLDLIVRTEFAVSPEAGAQMQRLFQDSLGATGMIGNLGFQTGAENFVLPQSGDDSLYRSST